MYTTNNNAVVTNVLKRSEHSKINLHNDDGLISVPCADTNMHMQACYYHIYVHIHHQHIDAHLHGTVFELP
jgi:hypothetical protein